MAKTNYPAKGTSDNRGGRRRTRGAGSIRSAGYASRSGYQYDRDRVAESIVAITAHYSGSEGYKQGYRQRFRCPECGKETLDANGRDLISGCWNRECGVPESVGAVKLVAYFERLDPGTDYKLILQRGYESAGIPPEPPLAGGNRAADEEAPAGAKDTAENQAVEPDVGVGAGYAGEISPDGSGAEDAVRDGALASERGADPAGREGGQDEEQLDLNDRVYRYVLSVCRLEKHHHEFWLGRGLDPETIAKAGLGSISKKRCNYFLRQIKKTFSEEELLTVPGFFINDYGRLSFTLFEEFTLIPYYDARGRVSTIEGRVYGRQPRKSEGKYVSLRGAGNHLYVSPGTDPNELVAFCEGPVGAIAAAQEGVAVGAIQGFRRYRGPSQSREEERPLPELCGVDFGGRTVPYIPDVDDPPQPHVLDEAPEAARFLVEFQNGRPATVRLPSGEDLDEYLLAVNKPARKYSLMKLLERATPTAGRGGFEENAEELSEIGEVDSKGTEEKEGSSSGSTRDGPNGGHDKGGKVVSGPWPGSRGSEETGEDSRNGSGRRDTKSATAVDERPPHQARRVRTRPELVEQDPYIWTGRDPGRHRQPLPSEVPVLKDEFLHGLFAAGVVLAALWGLVAGLYLAGGYVSGPGPLPPIIPADLAPQLMGWGEAAAEPANAALAAGVAMLLSMMSGMAVTYRESGYRKEKRRMLQGEIKW